jgi:hypothetical protein
MDISYRQRLETVPDSGLYTLQDRFRSTLTILFSIVGNIISDNQIYFRYAGIGFANTVGSYPERDQAPLLKIYIYFNRLVSLLTALR